MKNVARLFLAISFAAFLGRLEAQIAPQKVIDSAFVAAHFDPAIEKNKRLDSAFLWQTRAALIFYPELKNARIDFLVEKNRSPLSARPRVWAFFQRPEKRKYLVVISNETSAKLEPILLKNLPEQAQIGVLGHELSHVADFHSRRGIWFLKLAASHLSKKKVDVFENSTDRRAIEHGLGHQLLAWSIAVRERLKIEQWNGADGPSSGARERYMSPASIEKAMRQRP